MQYWLRTTPTFERAWANLSASAERPLTRPTAIARPRTAAEVVDAVHWAAEEGLPIAVRSGGHGLSIRTAACEGLALDLHHFHEVQIDPDAGTAWIGAGARVDRLAAELHRAGFSFPVGHAPTVGFGGFLLSGGNGWNSTHWGHGCERVRAVDVVLTDGTRTIIDAAGDPLLWHAARGAGSFFPAIALRFQVDLVRGRTFATRAFAELTATDPAAAGALVDCVDQFIADGGWALESTAFVRPAHAGREHPEVTIAVTSFDPDADPIEPLTATGLAVTTARTRPLAAHVAYLPRHHGDAMASDHLWTDASLEQLLPRLHRTDAELTNCTSVLFSRAARRADGGVPQNSVFTPKGTMSLSAFAHWNPAKPRHDHIAWMQGTTAAVADLRTGSYVGEADLKRPGAIEACFSAEQRAHLEQAARHYDPQSRMCHWRWWRT